MADTGYKNPTTTGSPDNSWTNPTNAFTEDGLFAVDDHTLGAVSQSYRTFGFGIPSDATIDGIEVRIKMKSTASGTMGVSIGSDIGSVHNSSATVGNKTQATTTTNTAYVLGGPTDKWGTSWEPEDFSDTNFVINPGVSSGAIDYSVDVIQVKVYYTTNSSNTTKTIPKLPGTATVQANSDGLNDGNWTNPNNILASDYSFASGNTSQGGQMTAEIYGSNFGFSIPTNSTIKGIELQLIKQGSPTLDLGVFLTKTAGTDVGSNKASATLWDFNLAIQKYGGPTDLWGTTWTPAEINSSGFGVSFSAYNQHGGGNAQLQMERLVVYYAPWVDTDLTLSASYAVGTPTDITKGFNYSVAAEQETTSSAQYSVLNTSPDILRNASYSVLNETTGPSYSALYDVAYDPSGFVFPALYEVQPAPVPEDLTSDVLRTLKIGKQYGPITSVVFGRVPQNDNIVIAAVSPQSYTITNVDVANDLFTIVGNEMIDGNLVRLVSDGTYPTPLAANTNYYIFTNGSPDTFYLTRTYDDAINGTRLINITDAGSGTLQLEHLTTQEAQINNNQIVDDDRQDLLQPVYAQLVGLEWNEVTADTVGLGWHEVGDIIQFTQGSTTVNGFISEIHLVLAGSVKEQLVSVIPDVSTINYQTAGGIIKTIYDTEIKVDKQENEITSIVSEQDVFATETQTNFTEIYQNITDIILSVQKSGGGNLLLNSVGFATDSLQDNSDVQYYHLTFWDYNPSYDIATHGTVTSYSSSESQNAGGISGQVIEMVGPSILLKQRVNVAVGAPLSFGMLVKNAINAGDVTVTLSNDIDTFTISIDDTARHDWDEYKLENFTSSMSFLDVEIAATTTLTQFQFTDLRLLYGTTLQPWVQASSEILATNVQFTKNGMKIFDNVHETETQVTYNEFSTRRKSDDLVLFEADDSGVITNDLSIKGSTNYYDSNGPMIKQITIPRGSNLAGVAFIKVVS